MCNIQKQGGLSEIFAKKDKRILNFYKSFFEFTK